MAGAAWRLVELDPDSEQPRSLGSDIALLPEQYQNMFRRAREARSGY